MSKYVSITAFCILFSSILIVYYISDSYAIEKIDSQNLFYSQNFDPTSSHVFIIGSSQVFMDMDVINSLLSDSKKSPITNMGLVHGNEFSSIHVYNLGLESDKPVKRINSVDNLIRANPDLVVYGIGFRDFFFNEKSKEENPVNFSSTGIILINPRIYFEEILKNNFNFNQNPKLFTFEKISDIINTFQNDSEKIFPDYLEFYSFPKVRLESYSTEELENKKLLDGLLDKPKINKDELKLNKIATIEIIKKLKDSNIDIVLFTTPYTSSFWNKVGTENMKLYVKTMEEISLETNTPLYFLHNKYSDQSIWTDHSHITLNYKGSIYAEDVGMIIQENVI